MGFFSQKKVETEEDKKYLLSIGSEKGIEAAHIIDAHYVRCYLSALKCFTEEKEIEKETPRLASEIVDKNKRKLECIKQKEHFLERMKDCIYLMKDLQEGILNPYYLNVDQWEDTPSISDTKTTEEILDEISKIEEKIGYTIFCENLLAWSSSVSGPTIKCTK